MRGSVRGLGLLGLLSVVTLIPGRSAPESTITPEAQMTQAVVSYGRRHHLGFLYGNVQEIVRESTKYCAEHPEKPYKAETLVAIAWVESNFNPQAIGLAGERGAWQIWDWKKYLKIVGGKNPFDVRTNLRMVVAELDEKMARYRDYKTGLIAYNGIYYKDGKLDDRYFQWVREKQSLIRMLVGVGDTDALAQLGASGMVARKE